MSTKVTKRTPKTSSPEKILKSLPAKEICWVRQTAQNSTNFYTTSKQDRSMYFLYQETPDGFLLVQKATTPVNFSEWISNWEAELNPEPQPEKPKRARKKA